MEKISGPKLVPSGTYDVAVNSEQWKYPSKNELTQTRYSSQIRLIRTAKWSGWIDKAIFSWQWVSNQRDTVIGYLYLLSN